MMRFVGIFFFFTLCGAVALPVFAKVGSPQVGPTQTTELGNIVHGADTQFIGFTNGFGVNDVTDVVWPHVLARRIVNIVFGVLGIITVIMILYAGFLWLTAAGEEDKTDKGRTLLFQAFIGLAIILSAWLIAYFIIDQLVKAILVK